VTDVFVCVSIHSTEAAMTRPSLAPTIADQAAVSSRPPQFGRRKASADMQRPVVFDAAAYEPRLATILPVYL